MLKNKVLLSEKWESGTKTLSNLSKYRAVDVYFWDSEVAPIRCYVYETRIVGGGMASQVSSDGVHTDVQVSLPRSGNAVSFSTVKALHHMSGGTHGTQVNSLPIYKIVGVEPIVPDLMGGA